MSLATRPGSALPSPPQSTTPSVDDRSSYQQPLVVATNPTTRSATPATILERDSATVTMVTLENASATYAHRSVDETVHELQADLVHGLRSEEAGFRRQRFGKNELEAKQEESLAAKFLDQLKQPLILLLLGSALISMLLRQFDDAISIVLAILIVITVAFVQEYRSEKSLEALTKLVPHYCHVLRDGRLITLYAHELVPGDVVQFSTGDRVPADIRLTDVAQLEIDESNLSGESRPRGKQTEPIEKLNIPVSERDNIAFMGTLVRGGHGKGIVVATGAKTEFGGIWELMNEVEDKKTPLQLRMEQLGKQLSFLSFGIIAVIGLIGLLQKRQLLETFTISVSLAVAAIPEGLPIVVTVTLALGVIRMAKKNAIIKRLPSVESLGSVSVLCADKTGTLTENKMHATKFFTVADGTVDASTDPNQTDRLRGSASFHTLLRIGSMCNNASIRDGNFIGQPTEIAILELAQKLDFPDERGMYTRTMEIPFDSDKKWMAVQYDLPTSGPLYYVKGAPEVIFEMCSDYFANGSQDPVTKQVKGLDAELKRATFREVDLMSNAGLRVLALAFGANLKKLTFVGLIAMYDRPRPGIATTIRKMQESGIRVVMITGDSEGTALSIAQQIGIHSPNRSSSVYLSSSGHVHDSTVLSGPTLDSLSERQLHDVAGSVCVYYRMTPRHKLMIVKALQAHGDVVAMTGDGVNDAPALKTSDIGIAMGKTGTDVSKEAAAMILVNDEFETILSAIEEGKSIYYNIRNFLRFQLSTSAAALVLIATATLLRLPTPLNAMQLLWINIIMDGPPAQSLGVEPVDQEVMRQPPRRKDSPIVDRTLMIRVLTSAAIIVVGTMLVYYTELVDGSVTAKDTTMTFTTFVFFDMFNALCCRNEKRSIFHVGFLTNKVFAYAVSASIACQLLVIYVPFFQSIFRTEALTWMEMLRIILISSSVFWIDEVRKWYQRRRFAKQYSKVDKELEMV